MSGQGERAVLQLEGGAPSPPWWRYRELGYATTATTERRPPAFVRASRVAELEPTIELETGSRTPYFPLHVFTVWRLVSSLDLG